jgi:hypothetical protein
MCDVSDSMFKLRFDQAVFDSVLNPHSTTSNDDGNIDHLLPPHCSYVDIDSINSFDITKRDISLFHLNTRSLNKNGNSVTDYISTFKHHYDIYGFTETWFNYQDEANLIDIEGYTSENCIREGRKGDGASLFINPKYTHPG